jgi:hypothetical protein
VAKVTSRVRVIAIRYVAKFRYQTGLLAQFQHAEKEESDDETGDREVMERSPGEVGHLSCETVDRRGGRCIHAFILHSLLISVEFLICTGVMGLGLFNLHVGLVLSLVSRTSSSSVLEHDQAYGRVLASTGKQRLHSDYDTS